MRHVVVIFSSMTIVVVVVTVMVVPHHLGQIMIVRLGPAAHPEPHPEGVIRRQSSGQQTQSPEDGTSVGKSLGQDDIFGPVARGNDRESCQAKRGIEHRPHHDAPSFDMTQTTQHSKVELTRKAVHDGPARQEEHRLEERVGEDVRGRAKRRKHPNAHEHVPQLGNG